MKFEFVDKEDAMVLSEREFYERVWALHTHKHPVSEIAKRLHVSTKKVHDVIFEKWSCM